MRIQNLSNALTIILLPLTLSSPLPRLTNLPNITSLTNAVAPLINSATGVITGVGGLLDAARTPIGQLGAPLEALGETLGPDELPKETGMILGGVAGIIGRLKRN
jgi:hypothetical protein